MNQLAYLLVFATALSAQSPCSIRGTVVDALTNQPLARTEIFANLDDDTALPVRRITDLKGAFCFEDLIAGNYLIEAKRARYLNANYGEQRPGGMGEVLQVAAHGSLSLPAIKMTPQAVISGLLVDADGDPLQGASITLLKPRWRGGQLTTDAVQQAVTDDQGRYRFAGLAAGTYFILAAPPGPREKLPSSPNFLDQNGQPFRQLEGNTYYKDSLSIRDATPIRLRAGQELSGLALTLSKADTRHVSGQVSAEALSTSPRFLYLSDEAYKGPGMMTSVPIQSDGSFHANGLFPGRYLLQGLGMKQEVDLTSGDVDGLVVELLEPIELLIAISSDPTQSSSRCTGIHGLRLVPKTSDPNEAVQIVNAEPISERQFKAVVSPGQYKVGIVPDGPPCLVKRVLIDGQPQSGRTLDIEKGSTKSIELLLTANVATIDGHITAGDQLKNEATLLLEKDTEQHFSKDQSVGADGKFQLYSLAPGKYRLYAFEDFDRENWGNPQLATLLASKSVEFEVKEGEHLHIAVPLISVEDFQEALRQTAF